MPRLTGNRVRYWRCDNQIRMDLNAPLILLKLKSENYSKSCTNHRISITARVGHL